MKSWEEKGLLCGGGGNPNVGAVVIIACTPALFWNEGVEWLLLVMAPEEGKVHKREEEPADVPFVSRARSQVFPKKGVRIIGRLRTDPTLTPLVVKGKIRGEGAEKNGREHPTGQNLRRREGLLYCGAGQG